MKKPKNRFKKKHIALAALLATCLVSLFAFMSIKYLRTSTPDIKWVEYTGEKTHVHFKYPSTATVSISEGNALTDKPENEVPIEDIHGYIISMNHNSTSDKYSTAESNAKSKNFDLDIQLGSTTTYYETPSTVSLKDYPDAINIRTISNLHYVLLNNVKGWGKSSYFAQCDQSNKCTAVIKREDPNLPYMSVTIRTVEGWRSGGAPIDYKSQEYKTMTDMVDSLVF
jgi:hypothetical protein